MALSAGTWLGPYEILASDGAGGMGEVYRAKDTRLADGQRFLVATPIGDDSAPPITLIQNWTALLRQGK